MFPIRILHFFVLYEQKTGMGSMAAYVNLPLFQLALLFNWPDSQVVQLNEI